MSDRKVDLTPSPRLLRMLGRIEFSNWQCLAELVDNSIDAITESGVGGEITILSPTINEYDDKGDNARLVVKDDGPGMSTDELEKNLRAGYSGNDPISKLGLFGMGFNIATARLGGRTKVRTTRQGDDKWKAVVIDFDEMERGESYDRTIETEDKANPEIHGTEIVITKLKERVRTLRRQPSVKEKLNRIYTPLLKENTLTIKLNNERLEGKEHCTWNGERSVTKNNEEIPARIDIDEEIGEEYYCKSCWTWWTESDIQQGNDGGDCPSCGENGDVVKREQKIEGWVGIQRFFDEDHYGIDFIRNGRIIEELDKSLFYWKEGEEEDELEYPIDTQHWGGRIVGEIHVNFVPVTYTKDHFERHDKRWKKVRHTLRGEAPLRPNIAKDRGYPENDSPIATLFSGYRSGREPGKKMLVPGREKSNGEVKGMNEKCKEWAQKFWEGHPDYQDDSKWWEAVEEAEEAKRSSGGGGGIDAVTPGGNTGTDDDDDDTDDEEDEEPLVAEEDEDIIEIEKKEEVADLSGDYDVSEFDEPSIDILVNKLVDGDLQGRPIVKDVKSSRDIEFTIDFEHPIFKGYGHSYMDMVLLELSHILHQRLEDPEEWTTAEIFSKLKDKHCADERLDPGALATQAKEILDRVRDTISREEVHVDPGRHSDDLVETVREEVFGRLGEGEETVTEVLATTEYLEYAPDEELVAYMEKNPEHFFDGAVWDRPYSGLGSESLQDRVVSEFRSYMTDVVWLAQEASDHDIEGMRDEVRMELMRASYSLDILQNELQA